MASANPAAAALLNLQAADGDIYQLSPPPENGGSQWSTAKNTGRRKNSHGSCCRLCKGVLVVLGPLLLIYNAYELLQRWGGHIRDISIKESYTRRREIESQLRVAVPDLKEHDAYKIAGAIDKHENFDRPQSLAVTGGLLSSKLTLYSSQQGGAKKVRQQYPRIKGLEKAISKIIKEQKETTFPVRKEINTAYRKFFLGFPSVDGRPCTIPTLWKELDNSTSRRVELQKQLLEDFRVRFTGFNKFLSKRSRDVQQVLWDEWMPMELRRAFAAFDLLCWKSEWITPSYRLPSARDGRIRAARWLRRDPDLRRLPVHIGDTDDQPPALLRLQRALPWRLRKMMPSAQT
ncbi:unnamed protein product [Effrenium voratum]|uniref:Uncharacterized protein n=1 Tax=Effrenium voratum TaxID=2562239 RepID=A0AA36N0I4_9DINO|nr:unnamed protein product [Effrenium voratum]